MNAISCSFTHKRLRFTSAAKTLSDRDAILFEDNSLKKKESFLVIRKIIDQTHAHT